MFSIHRHKQTAPVVATNPGLCLANAPWRQI